MIPARSELPTLARTPTVFVRRYWIPLVLLVIAATADGVTTYRNSVAYGTDIEVHPVQRWVFEWFGVAAGVPIAKTIQVAFVIFVAAWWRPWCGVLIGLCAVLYGLAAMSNHYLWV